jgi:hypothetical protein
VAEQASPPPPPPPTFFPIKFPGKSRNRENSHCVCIMNQSFLAPSDSVSSRTLCIRIKRLLQLSATLLLPITPSCNTRGVWWRRRASGPNVLNEEDQSPRSANRHYTSTYNALSPEPGQDERNNTSYNIGRSIVKIAAPDP